MSDMFDESAVRKFHRRKLGNVLNKHQHKEDNSEFDVHPDSDIPVTEKRIKEKKVKNI